MQAIILNLITFLISGGAFLYGIVRFYRKTTPMYFRLLVWAVGCYALKSLWGEINLLCGNQEPVNISVVGVIGCCWFLLSANLGTLDSIVDEHGASGRPARLIALAAPSVMLLDLLWAGYSCRGSVPVGSLILTGIGFLPVLPASYFCLKHLLLPVDTFGFLRATRLCNLFGLLICVGSYAIVLLSLQGEASRLTVISLVQALLLVGLVYACERGRRLWKISI